jgi:hypothetical protein
MRSVERLAGEQVVLGFGHPYQQRPADGGVITGGDAQLGVAVDDLRGAPRHRNVGEQRHDQARADGHAMNRRDHRFVEVDHVEHEVASLTHDPHPVVELAYGLVDQVEAAPGGEGLAFAADEDRTHVGVATDGRPDIGEIAVHLRAHGIEPGRIENQVQHAVIGAFDTQARKLVVVDFCVADWHPGS